MADYLRDELGRVLDQYDERRRAIQAREQKVRDEDALFIAGFAELRRSVVRPVFELAAAMLAERGHKVAIVEQEFAVDAGSKVTEAEIAIRIVPAGTQAPPDGEHARAFSISTRHYNKTVWINAGKPLEGAKGTYPLARIDRQLVEEQLVGFVAGIVGG
ncbi:MAG: hypothetical protein ACREUS_04780 [Burkholderiales bacterium]